MVEGDRDGNGKDKICILLQHSYIQDEQKIIGELLFEKKLSKHKKETIYKFWKIREQKIKTSV